MPRPKDPIYRHVLRDAFTRAWEAKRIWPVALIAGILLSGSVYDVIWRLLNSLASQTSLTVTVGFFTQQAFHSWSQFNLADMILSGVQVFQLTAVILILGFAVAACSIIGQGALVFFLGNRGGRRTGPTIKESLSVGAHAFWPIFVLNLLVLFVLWATRSALAVTLSMTADAGTIGSYFLYLAAFTVFAAVAITAVIIQIFALQAMILQGATLIQSLERAGRALQGHWVIAVETALLLFLISLIAGFLFTAATLAFMVPLFLIIMLGSMLGINNFIGIVMPVGVALFVAALLVLGAYLITLQYATWVNLYRRLGEGGALPKLHRWYRQLIHGFHVPGS